MPTTANRVGQLVGDELSEQQKELARRELADAEMMFTELCVIVVLGKILTSGGDMTAEFIGRCLIAAVEAIRQQTSGVYKAVVVIVSGHGRAAAGRPLGVSSVGGAESVPFEDTEGGKGALKVRELIRCMGGDNWPVYNADDPRNKLDTLQFPCIVIEPRAKNTEQNAEFTADYASYLRELIAAHLHRPPDHLPVELCISTARYHYDRMQVRNRLIPSKSEITTWRTSLPGATIRRLDVPFPPLSSGDESARWAAKVYEVAHIYFDALMANLFGIAEGRVDRLSPAAVCRCQQGIEKLAGLYHELKVADIAAGKYSRPVPTVHANLHDKLGTLNRLLQEIKAAIPKIWDSGEGVHSIAPGSWESWGRQLAVAISGPIRFEADPDRR